MKRITYYQARTRRNGERFPKNVFFQESKGTYVEITDIKGKKVELAVEYDRSEKKYFATELSTGIGTRPLGEKRKEDLLKTLSELDWERMLNIPHHLTVKQMLNEFKESLK